MVYGVKNLIAADDSIASLCMDGGPMASAYLIGANIALFLLKNSQKSRHLTNSSHNKRN